MIENRSFQDAWDPRREEERMGTVKGRSFFSSLRSRLTPLVDVTRENQKSKTIDHGLLPAEVLTFPLHKGTGGLQGPRTPLFNTLTWQVKV